MKQATLLLFLSLISLSPLWAEESPSTPKPVSPERKMLLRVLRTAVQQELKKPVIFKVDHFKVQNGWAFLYGKPLQLDGKPLDYKRTPYAEAMKQGIFDNWICALLQKQPNGWRVVRYVIGATDVPYTDWDRQYQAPPAIFQ